MINNQFNYNFNFPNFNLNLGNSASSGSLSSQPLSIDQSYRHRGQQDMEVDSFPVSTPTAQTSSYVHLMPTTPAALLDQEDNHSVVKSDAEVIPQLPLSPFPSLSAPQRPLLVTTTATSSLTQRILTPTSCSSSSSLLPCPPSSSNATTIPSPAQHLPLDRTQPPTPFTFDDIPATNAVTTTCSPRRGMTRKNECLSENNSEEKRPRIRELRFNDSANETYSFPYDFAEMQSRCSDDYGVRSAFEREVVKKDEERVCVHSTSREGYYSFTIDNDQIDRYESRYESAYNSLFETWSQSLGYIGRMVSSIVSGIVSMRRTILRRADVSRTYSSYNYETRRESIVTGPRTVDTSQTAPEIQVTDNRDAPDTDFVDTFAPGRWPQQQPQQPRPRLRSILHRPLQPQPTSAQPQAQLSQPQPSSVQPQPPQPQQLPQTQPQPTSTPSRPISARLRSISRSLPTTQQNQ